MTKKPDGAKLFRNVRTGATAVQLVMRGTEPSGLSEIIED